MRARKVKKPVGVENRPWLEDVLTVDVGYEDHLAWAFWFPDRKMICDKIPKSEKEYINRFFYTVVQYEHLLRRFGPQLVVLEGIEFWTTSRGVAAREDAVNTAYLVGALQYITLRDNINCKVVYSSEWRGQLTNTALNAAIQREFLFKPRDHVREAIGIGMNEMGMLNEFRRTDRKN